MRFKKSKGIHIVCLTVIYLLLTCFTPVLHNHGDYLVSLGSAVSATLKNSNTVIDEGGASIACPACIFNHSNTGFILSDIAVKTDYITTTYFPTRENPIQTYLLSSPHDRAPPILFS